MIVATAIAAACVAMPAAGADEQSSAERVAIFYYPWYSNPAKDGGWAHWYVDNEGTPVLSTAYYPSRGLYSSSNAKLVSAQMREIADAGVGTLVFSWWGFDSPENERPGLSGADGGGVALGGGGHGQFPVPMDSACFCTVFSAAAGSAPVLVTFSISVSNEVTTCSHVGNDGGAWAVSSCLPKTASFLSAVRAGSCHALLTAGGRSTCRTT